MENNTNVIHNTISIFDAKRENESICIYEKYTKEIDANLCTNVNPKKIFKILKKYFYFDKLLRENLLIFLLDGNNDLMGIVEAAIALARNADMDIQSVTSILMILQPCSIYECHNHPMTSQLPTFPPSSADKQQFKDFKKFLDDFYIELKDSIVVSGDMYYLVSELPKITLGDEHIYKVAKGHKA